MKEMSCNQHSLEGLIKISDEYYLCPICKRAFTKEDLKDILDQKEWEDAFGESNLSWCQVITEDESYWHMDAMTSFPYFIAHEYRRLFDMLKNGEEYGSLMQMKDVFEVTLKLPLVMILTGCEMKLREISNSYKAEKEERSLLELIKREYNQIYSITELILSKPLCIGDWERIANLAKKLNINKDLPQQLSNYYESLIPVIGKIEEKFRKLHISHWRNEAIGHGALALNSEEDNSLEEDYKKKLIGLKWMMEQCDDFYKIYHLAGDNEVYLDGYELDLKVLSDIKNYSIKNLTDKEHSIDLTPYLIHENNRIFIIDAYYSYKNKADMLNYSHGKKISNRKLLERFNGLHKLFEIASVPPKDIYSNNLSNVDIEAFEQTIASNEIYFPEYLHNWLSSVMYNHSHGIFLLEGERGTGKSQFANVLNELADTTYRNDKKKRHRIEGVMIRTWHFNSTYNSKIGNFKEGIVGDLRTFVDKSKGYKRLMPNQFKKNEVLSNACSTFISNREASGKDLAKLVSDILKGYQNEGKDIEKVLIFLDGVDEINPRLEEGERHAGQSVFDLLPKPEEIPDHVYFIVTSRLVDEVVDNQYIYNRLDKIRVTDTFTLNRDNQQYKKLLHKYAQNQIINKYLDQSDNDQQAISVADILLEKSQYRFNYLRAYEQLYRGNMDISSIDSGNLFQGFLEGIKSLGGRYYKAVLDFMVTLAVVSQEETLTLKEMAYLMGEETVTLKFMAIIMDMKGFLQISRSTRGNCISLSHVEWRTQILAAYSEYRQSIVKELGNKFYQFSSEIGNSIKDMSNDYYDGETWLAANVMDMVTLPKNENTKCAIERVFKYFQNPTGYMNDRYIKTLTGYIDVLIFMRGQGKLADENELASAYLNRGDAYCDKRKLDQGINDYNECIAIRENLNRKNTESLVVFDEDQLAKAYMNRGVAYEANSELSQAVNDYSASIAIREKLSDKSKEGSSIFDESDLAKAYMNRGNAYSGYGRVDDALTEYTAAIASMRRMEKKGEKDLIKFNVQLLAKAYLNRGSTYCEKEQYDEALKDYDISISIQEDLYAKKKSELILFDDDLLGSAYFGRATIMLTKENEAEAILDYKASITVFKRLIENRKRGVIDFDEADIAGAYRDLSIAYSRIGDREEGMKYLNASIGVFEVLYKKSQQGLIVFDETELALEYMNRAISYKTEGNTIEALNDAEASLLVFLQSDKIMNAKMSRLVPSLYLLLFLGNKLDILDQYWELIDNAYKTFIGMDKELLSNKIDGLLQYVSEMYEEYQ